MKWPVLAHGAWNRWWGPSLTRRTLLALLAAMGLVWLVLLAQMAYTHYETMGTNPGVRQLAQGLAVPLASMPDPVEARALVRGTAQTFNAMRLDVELLQGEKVLQILNFLRQAYPRTLPFVHGITQQVGQLQHQCWRLRRACQRQGI